ncbi:MAG: tetratricopeptide repeat protein, partial [Akkermansia sp.]|nr:tetratricopeptide repeat protein [Akkermansia sp.]
MNHTPLINSKRAMLFAAIAVSCPYVQANTAGYISTSSAAGTSQVGPTAVYAGDTQDSINHREAARRKAKTSEALELLQQGRTCYSQKQYVQALEKYEAAWKVVPKAPATQKLQEFLVKSIGDASIAVAMEYARVGRYDEAEQLLLDVLEREPNNKRAREELSLMRDPVRNNPALTPEHIKNVEEVNRLLNLAYGHLDLGKYDEAYDAFNRVIKIDPYNTAARRGQEAVSKRRSGYYRAAYDSYRAKALAEVDAVWEEQVPQVIPTLQAGSTESVTISEGVLRNRDILSNLRIASVDFVDVPMGDALEFLRNEFRKSGQLVNIIFNEVKESSV